MIAQPQPAWMDSDLQLLADTANKFFDRECLPLSSTQLASPPALAHPVTTHSVSTRPSVRAENFI